MLILFCRQLSSLSQHAEDMFRELFVEATTIFERTCNLSNKVDSLRDSVQQFDPNQVVGKFLTFSWFFMISGTAVLDWLSVLSSTQQKGLRVYCCLCFGCFFSLWLNGYQDDDHIAWLSDETLKKFCHWNWIAQCDFDPCLSVEVLRCEIIIKIRWCYFIQPNYLWAYFVFRYSQADRYYKEEAL